MIFAVQEVVMRQGEVGEVGQDGGDAVQVIFLYCSFFFFFSFLLKETNPVFPQGS